MVKKLITGHFSARMRKDLHFKSTCSPSGACRISGQGYADHPFQADLCSGTSADTTAAAPSLFEDNIRDYEYDCVVDLALEALDYEDKVLINAPFTREIRDMEYIENLEKKLAEKNATLVVVWVETSPEIVHKRMIERNSDRDTWKLEHWDEYIAGCNFEIPENLKRPGAKDSLIIFRNNNEKEFEYSMKKCISILDQTMKEDSLQQVG